MSKAKFKTIPVCSWCGSADVSADAYAQYNGKEGKWELRSAFDIQECSNCEGDADGIWVWCDDEGNAVLATSLEVGSVCPAGDGVLKEYNFWAEGNEPLAKFLICNKDKQHTFLIAADDSGE